MRDKIEFPRRVSTGQDNRLKEMLERDGRDVLEHENSRNKWLTLRRGSHALSDPGSRNVSTSPPKEALSPLFQRSPGSSAVFLPQISSEHRHGFLGEGEEREGRRRGS
eukprot:754437-Hanusia_phi.AAC.2